MNSANIVCNDFILERFSKFIALLDGGDLVKKSADLYTQQFRTVLESIELDDFTDILDKSKMKTSFLNVQSENPKYQHAASTKQSI